MIFLIFASVVTLVYIAGVKWGPLCVCSHSFAAHSSIGVCWRCSCLRPTTVGDYATIVLQKEME